MKDYLKESDIICYNQCIINFSHKFLKIKIGLDYDLPLEKTINMHNGIILIKDPPTDLSNF